MTKKHYHQPRIVCFIIEVCAPLANSITAGTDNPTENGSATGEPSPNDSPFPPSPSPAKPSGRPCSPPSVEDLYWEER